MKNPKWLKLLPLALALAGARAAPAQTAAAMPAPVTVLEAAHVFLPGSGRTLTPGMVVIRGRKIEAVGGRLAVPAGARLVRLPGLTLLPGLIDCHVHLFLHPGRAEDMQTVRESAAQRTVQAVLAAKADLWAGFTSARDMGTEGVGSASTAIRAAINAGEIPGPRLWVCANAISILGGHEDALGFNPALSIPSNADYANTTHELIQTIREQIKQGATFIKIYETGRDQFIGNHFFTPYQYTERQLAAAVREAARQRERVAVHVMGEPGALYAAQAGVMSLDHAVQLSPQTMRIMRQKHIPAVPTFAVFEAFARTGATPAARAFMRRFLAYKIAQFHRQIAAGIDFAAGSDVGPFPHGTQTSEFVYLHRYGLSALRTLQAGTTVAAAMLGASDLLGRLRAGYAADVIGVPGNPLANVSLLEHVQFVMKAGTIYRLPGQPNWLKKYWAMPVNAPGAKF